MVLVSEPESNMSSFTAKKLDTKLPPAVRLAHTDHSSVGCREEASKFYDLGKYVSQEWAKLAESASFLWRRQNEASASA